MSKPVILTGLRANAEFHLGNYLGAAKPMVELLKKHGGEYQLNLFLPDLHSITAPDEQAQVYKQGLRNLKLLIAAGYDLTQPDVFMYRQSYISAHAELAWILECFTYFGELSRMTQFKEKAGEQDNVSVGLFNYPALMAADILLYGAEWIPLGADQQQHLELTRDLAIRMNNKFGELFVVPHEWNKQLEFSGRTISVRVRSLRNPDKKMSKSVDDPAGTIMLGDDPAEAAKKVLEATTDSEGGIHLDWEKQPGVSNLLQISALLAGKPVEDTAQEWEGKNSYGELKSQVAEQVQSFLTNLQTKLDQVDEQQLLAKLEADEAKMREVANQTLQRVQGAVGLRANG